MSENKKNVGELKQSFIKKESVQLEWKLDHFNFEPKFFRYESRPFIFAGNIWLFRLSNIMGDVYISIVTNDGENVLKNNTYELNLKNVDGDVKYFPSEKILGILKKTCPYIIGLYNKQSLELIEKFAPENTLTVVCTIKRNCATKSKSASPVKLIGLNKLSENSKQILTNKDSCDVTFRVKEKEFHAHKTILINKSPVFACMFCHDSSENQTGIVNIPDCDPDSFKKFLEYLNCGKLEDLSFCSVLNLYSTADKYNVQELTSFCIDYLTQCLTLDNVCEVLILADLTDDEELFSAAKDFFHENSREVVASSQWKELLQSGSNINVVNKLIIDVSKKRKMCDCSS